MRSILLPRTFFANIEELTLEGGLPFPLAEIRGAPRLRILDVFRMKSPEAFLGSLPALMKVMAVKSSFVEEDMEINRALNRRAASENEGLSFQGDDGTSG